MKGFEHVVADADEILDALRLELILAGGRSGHDEDGPAVEQLVGFGGERRVVVVRCADYDDVGFRLDGGAYPFLDAVEISVVLHADAGAGEEVARELGPGPGERERSDCHHESLRALSAPVDLQTHLLESHRAAIGLQRANALGRLRRAAATARALARNDLFGDFVAGHLVEIRELIRSEQRLAPLGDVQVLLGGRGFDLILNKSGLERGDVASFFFDLLEQAPRLLGNRGGQVLDVV